MGDLIPLMVRHVHLHFLVPGGALRDDGQWQASRGNYLFPVRALSRRFRGRMVAGLRLAAGRGEFGRVTREGEIDALLERLMAQEWVVYTKHCLQHTATVVDYLARYTHRIAITNARILAVDDRRVTLRYKDYRDGDRHKTLCLGRRGVRAPIPDARAAQGTDAYLPLRLSCQPWPAQHA
jgi:hypothetical protein